MSVTAEFEVMKNRIWDAIQIGLLRAGDDAKEILQLKMYENVYSYQASALAMEKRRYDDGGLGDKSNMVASVVDIGKAERYKELQIEDFAGFQDYGPNTRSFYSGAVGSIGPMMNLQDRSGTAQETARKYGVSAGDRLDRVVTEGDRNYHQPGPRPFYEPTEKELANGGVVSGQIVGALMDAGFTVEVL